MGSFPPNLVAYLDDAKQKEIMLFIHQNYAWPQVMERTPFEKMWKTILQMYRIRMDSNDTNIEENSKAGQDAKSVDSEKSKGTEVRVADSVVFDAVERLVDLHHFVAFKEGLPIQYNIPRYFDTRNEDAFYHPFRDRIQAGNCLLAWNFDNEEIYRKHAILARTFYLYGLCFASSEFNFNVSYVDRMDNFGRTQQVPEITEIGTTFDPIAISKIWLNYRLASTDMNYQPCPFWFNETPRFATLQNQYNAQTNPFGFLNLDKVMAQTGPDWLFSEPEMGLFRENLQKVVGMEEYNGYTLPQILKAEYSVEALWNFYPMLPLDPQTMDWITYPDGTPVPYHRYVLNSFGPNLAGHQIMLRLQRNFYPRDILPIYGTSHLPDQDSGLYCPSIGYLLWNHYKEIVTCKEQYLANKDWINNPPSWVLASSPAMEKDLTASGAKIPVNGQNDFGWRTPYDATGTTVAMMQSIRDQAQVSAKSSDAILGKAMGGRTSATEAQNVFQASMSAVTTPINIFNYDMMGGFAWRVWEYTATWFPPELLKRITGQMGFVLKPEDLWTRVGLKWDVGSSYIESIVRQQNVRYMLESSMGDPSINRAPMWKALLELWRFDTGAEWVNDGGFDKEVYTATMQAIKTFMGEDIIINPDQNHSIAIKVKSRFLEDQEGPYMANPATAVYAPKIVFQVQIHQQMLMMQMHQQLLMQQAGNANIATSQSPALGGQQAPPLQAPFVPADPAQVAQAGGASLN